MGQKERNTRYSEMMNFSKNVASKTGKGVEEDENKMLRFFYA